jgi:hypothetical protein
MGILLTIVALVVLLGGVFTFAHFVVRRSTRGSATQAANLFSRYPESRPLPDDENTAPPRIVGGGPRESRGADSTRP